MWATIRLMSMDFGWACPCVWVGGGRKQEGRPLVWETCKVCNETNHSWFVSFHLLPLPPTNLQNTSGHVPPTYTSPKHRSPTMSTPTPHNMISPPSTPRKCSLSQAKRVRPGQLPVPHVGLDGQRELDHEPEQQHENRHERRRPAYQRRRQCCARVHTVGAPSSARPS